ncbi:MAG TPA: 3-dehydroquinate synthase family protein [Bacteroidales bacterium]|nr:3-dehydroquinate synthase family protein [Bacteroidales bacterium]
MDKKSTIRIGNNKSPLIISENPVMDFKRWWQLRIGTHKTTPVIILVDRTVHSAYSVLIGDLLKNLPVSVIETRQIDAGENCKQWDNAGVILKEWINFPVTKDTVIICMGGGTVTDLGGFIAAIYKRGLRTVYIPTTLMAMTDASLGGKNAINAGSDKNQLGTISFPQFTLVSTMWLASLPAREIQSGYAEIIKHALLDDYSFVKTILDISDTSVPPPLSLLVRSIRVKMKIVTDDPYETHERLWLNLGHSFGHAYESFFYATGNPVSHGHAVAIGLAEALYFSTILLGFSKKIYAEVIIWLRQQFIIDSLPEWNEIRASVLKDKKNISSGIRLVLLKSPGNPLLRSMDESTCQTLHADFLKQL